MNNYVKIPTEFTRVDNAHITFSWPYKEDAWSNISFKSTYSYSQLRNDTSNLVDLVVLALWDFPQNNHATPMGRDPPYIEINQIQTLAHLQKQILIKTKRKIKKILFRQTFRSLSKILSINFIVICSKEWWYLVDIPSF